MIAQVGMAVNKVAAKPITLREIDMGNMAWVMRVAQTARDAVMPHCDAHRPTTHPPTSPTPAFPKGKEYHITISNTTRMNYSTLGRAGDRLSINSCFCTANGGIFLLPRAAFYTVAAAVVMPCMTVGMVETARRETRFPTVGTAIHAKAKPTATATAFCIYFIPS